MEMLEEMAIQRYMLLHEDIAWLKRKKIIKRWEFYQQTFSSHVAFTGLEVISQSIPVDKGVEQLDTIQRTMELRIEIANLKRSYWNKFLQSLTQLEQEYFHFKYVKGQQRLNDRLDNLAIDEIQEIQEAIAYHYNFRDEDTDQIELIEDDYFSNMESILEAIGG